MKRFVLLTILFLSGFQMMMAFTAPADSVKRKMTLRGVIYEQQTGEPLIGATVQLMDGNGKMVKGATTTPDGKYVIAGVEAAKSYSVKVSFMGYETQTLNVKLPDKTGNFKISDIHLREQSQWLAETVITAKAPKVSVVEDTTMYHASAYTVPEGSVVEELLKKLPGVEIEDGKVTLNGKEITQILVDGKEFFGNDTEITLKNLPADIVEKIKAYEKKSDNARITGIDDGNEQAVIDLSLKPDKKKGWFGNVDAGYGTYNRYDGRVNLNRFTGEQRFSLVGNANNTRGNGRNANQSGGFNFNINTDKTESNGNVRINTSQGRSNSWSSSESFENKDAAFSNRRSASNNRSLRVNVDYRLEWRPDTMTHINFRPNFSVSTNSSESSNESASFNGDPYSIEGITDPLAQLESLADLIGVNHNINANRSQGQSFSGSASLLYNRRLAKRGRNVSFNVSGGFGDNSSNSSSYSQIDYYQIMASTGEDSVYHKIQYNDSPNKNYNIGANVSYSEPINDSTFLQFSYNLNYRYQDNNRDVSSLFDPLIGNLGAGLENYDNWRGDAQPDIEQCRYVENKYFNHDIRLQVLFNRSKYNLTAGINLQPQTSIVEYAKGKREYNISRTVFNVAPTINYRYRFSRQEQLRFTYRGNTGQPSITDLIPDTLDNSNPLSIRLGNAELKPSFTHNISLEYNKFIQEHQQNYGARLNFRATQNAVSSRSEYDPITGGRVTKPENINGNWNLSGNFNFNTALPDDRFRVDANTTTNYTNSVGFVYQRDEQVTVKNKTGNLRLGENMRGSFRNDWLEIALNGSINYNHSRSSSTLASNMDTYHFGYGGSTQVELPWNFTFSTDVTNNSRRGYSDAAMNNDELIWNMQLSKRFLKGNAAVLSFRWYDILNKRSNVNRSVSAFSRTDTSTEGIYSYCMLHFIYRFNVFGGGNNRSNDSGRERIGGVRGAGGAREFGGTGVQRRG